MKEREGGGEGEEGKGVFAHRGGKKDGRRGGGKLQMDSPDFKAAHPAEVFGLTT